MSVNEYIAGGIGGISGVIIGHPLDTTKIQMQIRTVGEHNLSKVTDAFASVAAQGLRKGLYRGMLFPVASYGFVNSIFFGVYGNTIKLMQPDESIEATNMQLYLAGCIAGSAQLVFACPVEVIKCTMQAQIPLTVLKDSHLYKKVVVPKKYFSSPIQCFVDIVKNEGVRGLYKGLSATFLRDVPSFGLYLLVYERLFKFFNKSRFTDDNGIAAAMLAGGMSGSITWASIMPIDVIKSRLQASTSGFAEVDHGKRYRGFWDCLIKSVQKGGFSILFRGTSITVARAFPVNSVTFLVYSQLLHKLDLINPPPHRHNSGKQRRENEEDNNNNNNISLHRDHESVHCLDSFYHEGHHHFVPTSHAFPFLYENSQH